MSETTAGSPATPDAAPQAMLGDALVRTMKLLQSMKHHAPRAHPEVDPMAYPVLFTLSCRPSRLSELADKVYADVSTMSRQVTHLVGLGMIDRLPDPDDGRAQLLTVTDAGVQLLDDLRRGRETWLRGLLEGWSEPDVRTFTDYLQRFADAVERSRGALPHEAAATSPSTTTPQDVS